MKVLFNYAHNKFFKSQKLNSETGLGVGGFDKVYEYNKKDIDSTFYDLRPPQRSRLLVMEISFC